MRVEKISALGVAARRSCRADDVDDRVQRAERVRHRCVLVGPWPGVAGERTARTTPNFVTDGLVRAAYRVWF